LLDQIGGFKKSSLQSVTTVVTDRLGNRSTEDGTEVAGAAAGFILSDVTSEDTEDVPSETIEFTSHSEDLDVEELQARVAWTIQRDKIGNGFVCAEVDSPRVALFVEKKSKHEQHFDSFSLHLHSYCKLEQVDQKDLLHCLEDNEQPYSAIIFPGGAVWDVHKSLGEEAARKVARFVFNGGGYVGVCAGAFLASGKGYQGCCEGWQLISVDTSWFPGVGKATVQISNESDYLGAKGKDLFFANGPMFNSHNSKGFNTLINQETQAPQVLAEYIEISTPQAQAPKKQLKQFPAAVVAGQFGNGKIVCFGPHPEASGLQWGRCLSHTVQHVCCQKRNT